MAWFDPFNSGWFNGWFRSNADEPVEVSASFSFQGTSTFNCNAIAHAPQTNAPTNQLVGGYSRRSKSKIRWGEHPKFVYAEFKFVGEATFNLDLIGEITPKFNWVEDPSVLAVGCTLELKSEFLTFDWKQTSNLKVSSKVIEGPKPIKKQPTIKAEAVEIELLEEEEFALLLLI